MTNGYLTKRTMYGFGVKIKTALMVCLLVTVGLSVSAGNGSNEGSQYSPAVQALKNLYDTNQDFAATVDNMLQSAAVPPDGWAADPKDPRKLFNWRKKNIDDLLDFFQGWSTFVPDNENGMKYYELLYGLCYQNENALKFVETDPGLSWTRQFVLERGKYMDTEKSIKDNIETMDKWYNALGKRWNDFKPPHPVTEGYKGYKTFNEFFTRELANDTVRPIASPKDDSILAAPADGLINVVNANLDTDSLIHTKYEEYLNIEQLLHGSRYAKYFLGGTACSTVLLPPDYHHYHSPVAGHVVESKEVDVQGIYFGMDGNFFTYSNNGNIGGYKSKYGIFGLYHRGYYIYKTKHHGYVGMVSVGLDDISSVVFVDKFKNVKPSNPEKVKKGELVGHFAYGGSTVILLFQPGVFMGIKTKQGAQIGAINAIDGTAGKAAPNVKQFYHHKKKK